MLRNCLLIAATLMVAGLSAFIDAQVADAQDADALDATDVVAPGESGVLDQRPATTNELIVRQWLSRAGRSNNDKAEAIAALTRLQRFKEVSRLLASIDPTTVPASVQAAMAQQIGPANFVRIRQNESIGDAARKNLDALSKASTASASARATLQKAINTIASEKSDSDARLSAARTLVRGGNASIIAVTQSLVTKPFAEAENQKAREELLRVLLSFGDDALVPLQRLALYGKPDQRVGALRSLKSVDRRRFIPIWLTALHARDSTDAERQIAYAAIQRWESQPVGFDSSLAYLINDLSTRRKVVRLIANETDLESETPRSLQTTAVWSIGSDRETISTARMTEYELAYRDIVDASARLKRLGSLPASTALDVFAAEVGYQLALDPDWLFDLTPVDLIAVDLKAARQIDPIDSWKATMQSAAQIQSITKDSASNLVDPISVTQTSADDWFARALARANDLGDEAAILGFIRVLSETLRVANDDNQRISMHHSLLSSQAVTDASGLPVLVQLAAASPRTRIRYEAALLVSDIAISNDEHVHHFAGQARVKRTLAEMARLTDRPVLVLVETRSGIRVDVERLANEMGMQIECVATVSDLQQLINRGGDFRAILAKSNLKDQRPIELLDTVRRLPRGRLLPIVFYPADQIELNMPFESRWDAPLLQLDGPVTRAAINEVIAGGQNTPVIEPLTGLERRSFRETASLRLKQW